ncbi:MAG: gamma carbonic anhydrase family protein [bacterium (Candidatus Stahlbacteria) CG23_combo_of_CG06-09_8_20_14_all_34_7]|nr:MAG: gamma carbonic anhydrase family protein [bacterium (Candidatus Stahlbacteria) CG23_combo_of_CG06-09_8_20_14_all_34_7]
MLIKISNKRPILPFYLSEDAALIGDVRCKEMSSIWFKSVLRADINYIELGKNSNIQDMCVCHVTEELPCIIGEYVTIGHNAVLHGCQIGDYVLIGMGSIILDKAKIGKGSIVAAGTVIKEGMIVPPFSLVAGVPGIIKKKLGPEMIENLKKHALSYVEYAKAMKMNSHVIQ